MGDVPDVISFAHCEFIDTSPTLNAHKPKGNGDLPRASVRVREGTHRG